jgi:hypothetical protein
VSVLLELEEQVLVEMEVEVAKKLMVAEMVDLLAEEEKVVVVGVVMVSLAMVVEK